jgi:hypothetical protein
MDAREADTEMVVYPLDFYRRSELQWKRRVKASMRSQRDDSSANRGNECCPNCRLRSQHRLCLDTFQAASLNITGCARVATLVGPPVLIRCWLKTAGNRRR